MAKKTVVRTRAEVAKHFGTATRRVVGWFKAGCPNEPGRYDLEAIGSWRMKEAILDAHAAGMIPDESDLQGAAIEAMKKMKRVVIDAVAEALPTIIAGGLFGEFAEAISAAGFIARQSDQGNHL